MAVSGTSIGYPLKMSPALDPKPWGGSGLQRYGKLLPPEPIGESLESGSESRILNGSLAGHTLAAVVASHGRQLLGVRGLGASGQFRDFPLLIKLIDAQQDLSVQVHPDDLGAPAGKRGKTEAWLVLHTAQGAHLITGLDGAPERERIGRQVHSQPVQAGEVYFVPAGTVHAIGSGVLLYEVQQASDVTYRLYDWGRDREMHWDDGVAATRSHQRATLVTPLRLSGEREMLVACEYFALERLTIDGRLRVPACHETFRVLTVLDGSLALSDVAANVGDTLVLPADFPGSDAVGSCTVLVAYIPNVTKDVVEPLLAAGHSRAAIDALGVA